jgi:hypothetical protein
MPMWGWIAIGVGSFVALSLLVGFVLARILGAIGREVSGMYETEHWTTMAPTRSSREIEQPQPDADDARITRVVRLR